MTEEEFQKTAVDLMNIKGNEKGHAYLMILNYVRKEKGEEGILLIKNKLKELGSDLDIDNIDNYQWYPVGTLNLVILIAKREFNWNDSDIFEMGYSSTTLSLLVKVFSRYFISIDRFLNTMSTMYSKIYDFGELRVIEVNKKEKYFIVGMIRYGNFPPETCIFFQGVFKRISELVIGSSKIKVQETNCTHRGDDHHEYRVDWE